MRRGFYTLTGHIGLVIIILRGYKELRITRVPPIREQVTMRCAWLSAKKPFFPAVSVARQSIAISK